MSPTDIAEVSVPSNPIAGRLRLIAQAGVLKTLDPNGVRKTVLTDVDMCFAGEPVNYVAATPGTGTFTMENGEVTATMAMTAAVSGDLGVEYPGLQLVDPQVPDAELSLDDAGNFVVVSLATGTEGEILSRLDDVRDYINTHSVRMIGGDTTNGTTLCVPNEISQGVNGGTDEVLGTPARLGRTATDGTDVWTALKDDPTTTQDGWVKTFTGGA